MAEANKKIYISKGGNLETIQLYDSLSDVGETALRVKDGDNTLFAKLVDTSDAKATSLRCISGGSTKAAAKWNRDPHTKILMHFDDFPNDKVLDDAGIVSWTNLHFGHDTTNKKFGTGSQSAYYNIVSNNVTTAMVDWFRGNFTIEFWGYIASNASLFGFQIRDSACLVLGVLNLQLYAMYRPNFNAETIRDPNNNYVRIPQQQWFHLAMTRDITSNHPFKFFLNGTLVAYKDGSANLEDVTDLRFYAPKQTTDISRIDELRVSDICRYSSNFTPPSSPFTM